VTEENTFGTQANTVAGEVNTNATTATTKASEASTSAANALSYSAIAAGLANYGGAWSTLTGAKTVPLSVDHLGAFWVLLENIADVTAEVPGTSTKWAKAFGAGAIQERASNIALVAENNGDIIEFTSGTFTQTFDTAANLGEGWSVTLRNLAANITLSPTGGNTIDFGYMGPGQVFSIFCDGVSNFTVIAQDESSRLGVTAAFESSGTFTAKKSGWHQVTVVGGGGSGAISYSDVSTQQRATGGAAGGFSKKQFWALSGTVYSVTIGAGGTGAGARSTNGVTAGSVGGNSTFIGFGVSITANGGSGGTAVNGTTATTTGAAGGTAIGGDLNYTGGASGSAQNTSASLAATGGGAAGVNGTGFASGAAVAGSAYYAATGGAGVGGSSGAATASSTNAYTGGGGSAGAGADGTNATGAPGIGFTKLTVSQLNSAGSAGGGSTPAGNGGAGSGAATGTSGDGTLFAGSGAAVANSAYCSVGTGGIGAGSGGGVLYDGATGQQVLGRAGGAGIVIVEY